MDQKQKILSIGMSQDRKRILISENILIIKGLKKPQIRSFNCDFAQLINISYILFLHKVKFKSMIQ